MTTLLDNADPGVRDVALVPATDPLLMFERLAKDPAVDPDKLSKLIDLQERIMRHNAKAAFEQAFAKMAPEIPEIDEHGKILNKDRSVRSRYAPLEDIHKAIKPILSRHGFAMRHRTEWPADKPGVIRIVGILSHEHGHSEESAFEAQADKSDYRTDIQSQGSTVSYGRRYTTLDLLNIATRGADNDGRNQREQAPPPPEDFDKWWAALTTAAAKGLKAFEPAWECSEGPLKNYAHQWRRDELNALKATASAASKGKP